VLIIEDNADAAETLADLLVLNGHHTRIAHDGTSGIALALELKPDFVLCDLGLPDLDGYAVARALRSNAALSRTRLVALSGYAQAEDRARARDAGFDAHLPKPPPLSELYDLLAAGG
jgi:CheY-like chemotaxis protein